MASGLAESFMRRWRRGEHPDLEIIDQLGTLGLSSDPAVAAQGTKPLYAIIIEGLCDDFSSAGVELCNLVLLRLLALVRKHPAGRRTDELLTSLNYGGPEELLERYRRLNRPDLPAAAEPEKVRKVIILSRVTVGADVAITSIMVHRLRQYFVNAELVLVGPGHLEEIFCDLARVSYLSFNYVRQGTLAERLALWSELHDLVRRQSRGLSDGEILLFDPDSRLSQLGLLPLLAERDTLFFNSRQDQPPSRQNLSLSQLTNGWLNIILNENKQIQPMVASCPAHNEAARVFFSQFSRSSVVLANFGVGGNGRKRVADPFEEELVLALLRQPDTILLLDTGSSLEEENRVNNLCSSAENRGINTGTVNESELAAKKINFSHGIISFKGGVGSLAAVIGQSLVCIGYDSCCRHLATAMGRPAVIVFAGAPNQRFRNRWRPANPKGVTVTIPVEGQPGPAETPELVKKVIAAVRELSQLRTT